MGQCMGVKKVGTPRVTTLKKCDNEGKEWYRNWMDGWVKINW